jgi:selenoprotein W-related protein
LADTLKQRLPQVTGATLTPSSGGAFEIRVDGKLVFSKLQTRRFPEVDEAIRLVQNA